MRFVHLENAIGRDGVFAAVVVTVEESNAGTHGFDEVLAGGIRDPMPELEHGLCRGFDKVARRSA